MPRKQTVKLQSPLEWQYWTEYLDVGLFTRRLFKLLGIGWRLILSPDLRLCLKFLRKHFIFCILQIIQHRLGSKVVSFHFSSYKNQYVKWFGLKQNKSFAVCLALKQNIFYIQNIYMYSIFRAFALIEIKCNNAIKHTCMELIAVRCSLWIHGVLQYKMSLPIEKNAQGGT